MTVVTGKARQDPRKRAQLGLAIFFALLILLSVPAYLLRIRGIASLAVLFPPAIASIIARLILREGFRDVSFTFRGRSLRKAYAIAYLLPMAVAFIAYGLSWVSGLTAFDFSVIQSTARVPLPEGTVPGFLAWVLFSWTVVTAMFVLLVLGEEIGWRGYMLTRLIDAGAPRPLLLHGLIWAAYHVPLIVFGAYSAAAGPSVWLSVILFTVTATAFSYLLAWLRLDTGSIWPGCVAHATSNALTQNAFNPVTQGEASMLWIGEGGILTAVVMVSIMLLVRRAYGQLRYNGGRGSWARGGETGARPPGVW